MTEVVSRLVEFVEALRTKGINAGPSETIDAALAMETLGLSDRTVLREGLAASLVRRGGQREVFDQTFDLFFPSGIGVPQAALMPDDLDVEQLRELLAAALADMDNRALEQIAQLAVDMLGRVGDEGQAPAGWSAYQTLDRLQPNTVVAAATEMRGGGGSGEEGQGTGAGSGFVGRLERDEIRQGVEAFREMVSAEARRRTAEIRGREVVTRHAVRTGGNQIDFLTANKKQMAELRRTVQPLARKLATRLANKRRRRRRGPIDMRRTLRRAMGTGGVPVRPVFVKPRPSRPELVLLCDVSGSVAGFSNFTMLLVQALSAQFSKIRVFAFVNAMDEVTDMVKDATLGGGGEELSSRLMNEARLTNWHSSSDYGEALLDFQEKYLAAVGPRTAVLILGDARNNNQNPRLEVLHDIAGRSKRTFWLNPEHPTRWGLGDSEAKAYAEVVPMYQCSNVDQLSTFITRLLPV